MKLSRVKANELNIVSRGGGGVVEDSLSLAKKNAVPTKVANLSIEASKTPEKPGRKSKSQMVSMNPSVPIKGPTEIESLVTSS